MNSTRTFLALFVTSIALLTTACSSTPVTKTEMSIPQQTVHTARVLDPGLEDPTVRTYIQNAEERIEQAKICASDEDYYNARIHLTHAQGYAEVALELARNQNALHDLKQTKREIEMVREAIDNS